MSSYPQLNDRTRGWLRFLWRKSTTADDWSMGSEPHPWWDRYSSPPMLNFPRFDLSESTYAIALMADATPAWREVYTQILDELIERHTTFWAAVDWLTFIGNDPNRDKYPEAYRGNLVPAHLWGNYDAPGWTANGVEPWGLDPDPIGAQGNLFFRGFLNLMLGFRGYVSNDGKWHEPWHMTGLENEQFEWTHPCVANHLTDQMSARPEGVHCENTKIWPFCMTAAGLGLYMFDALYNQGSQWAFHEWIEYAKKNYMTITGDGRLETMALYYDPLIDHVHDGGPGGGMGVAWYMLPQNRQLAELLYTAAVETLGWNDPSKPVAGQGRSLSMGLVMAQEMGDQITEVRLRDAVESRCEPRFFGTDEEHFGWWFQLGEDWPRGQLSAYTMLAEIGTEGSWWRLFNEPNLSKFEEPEVQGVDYPVLGISQAWNDLEHGLLKIETYAATKSRRGDKTSFRVERVPDPEAVFIRLDGEPYFDWRRNPDGAIEIDTDVGRHSFQVHTGYRDPDARRRSEAARHAGLLSDDRTARTARTASISAGGGAAAGAIQQAAARVAAGGSTCPCCSAAS
ncbi:MAG: hypothetical protein VYE73_12145 [Acidobacteriota bacterium]|nr:hypothetical protein [Acidobacteriota bacterium]